MWEVLTHQWVANFAQIGMAIITLITAGIIAWYTIETSKLRKVSQQQADVALRTYQHSLMPVVVFKTFIEWKEEEDGRVTGTRPVLSNIGSGPAFNILIGPLHYDLVAFGFECIPYLEPRAETECDMLQDSRSKLCYEEFLDAVVWKGILPPRTLEINFCDVAGTGYATKYTIEPRILRQGEPDEPSSFLTLYEGTVRSNLKPDPRGYVKLPLDD